MKVFTIYRFDGYLGHVTNIIFIIFHFYIPKIYIENLVKHRLVVTEKIKLQFSYVNDLGSRSRNDIDLQYSHNFTNSISCLHLPAFRSQAATVSEKCIVFTFSHRKLLNVFGVGVSCRNLYSFDVYLYVNGSGSITSVGEERASLSAVVYL